MDRLLSPGRIIFATSMIALGVLCVQYQDFIVGRPPVWPAELAFNPILGYTSGTVLVVAAILVLLNKHAALAALVIGAEVLMLSVSRHVPQFMLDWVNAYKALALVGASFVIAAISANQHKGDRYLSVHKRSATFVIQSGIALLSIFFMACGFAHFKWADGVQHIVPEYIPFRLFWTYLTGACLFAGGAGLIILRVRKWAAFMLALMLFGWLVLLHLPVFIAAPGDYNARVGLCEVSAFTGICCMLSAHFSIDHHAHVL